MEDNKQYFIEWLDKIAQQIEIIKKSQSQYHLFMQKNNEEKIESFKSAFNFWIRFNYEFCMIILISRLIESSNRTDDLNFQKFLREFKDFYNINKQKLIDTIIQAKIKFYDDYKTPTMTSIPIDNDPFEQIRLEHIKKITTLDIDTDLMTLNKYYEQLKLIRHKVYAHFTDYKGDITITHNDLEQIINDVINIFNQYAYILNNTGCFF